MAKVSQTVHAARASLQQLLATLQENGTPLQDQGINVDLVRQSASQLVDLLDHEFDEVATRRSEQSQTLRGLQMAVAYQKRRREEANQELDKEQALRARGEGYRRCGSSGQGYLIHPSRQVR